MEWTNTSPIISKLTDMIKKNGLDLVHQNKTTVRGGSVVDIN